MLQDARLAGEFADEMLQKGIYVIGFSFPVVPKGRLMRVTLAAIEFTVTCMEVQREVYCNTHPMK